MNRVNARVELHRELVPLAEAAAVAYHVITEKPERLREPHHLAEVRSLVAVALSSVGTILRQENGSVVPLASREIRERLFVPRGRTPDLSDLCMRRVELLHAIELLKAAHVAFDRAHVLDALRED
jgi:hypothetical protein